MKYQHQVKSGCRWTDAPAIYGPRKTLARWNSRISARAVILSIALLFFGNNQLLGQDEAPKKDPWFHGMSEEAARDFMRHQTDVDNRYVHVVTLDDEKSAEQILRTRAIQKISIEQAKQFSGQQLPILPGKDYYLVRGVYYNEKIGGFHAAVSGRTLHVSHLSLGTAGSMGRRALVVALKERPTEVYVTCGVTL